MIKSLSIGKQNIFFEEKYYPWIAAGIVFFIGFILSFYRCPATDECTYLQETVIISERLRNFQWFGNDNVGLHGFVSKFAVALLFIITGPSVWVASIFHVILGAISAYLIYKISNHFIKDANYSLFATLLTVFSYYYIGSISSYTREMAVILPLLLFIYALIKDKPFWLLGFLFVLVLDGKEYIAIILIPSLLIWIVLDEIIHKKDGFSIICKNILLKSFFLFTPALFWIILMFSTNIIPVNWFLATFLQLTTKGRNLASPGLGLQAHASGTDINRVFLLEIKENFHYCHKLIFNIINIVLIYAQKIVSPRIFSYLSFPLYMVVFSVFGAVNFIRENWKKREFLYIGIFFFTFLLIYFIKPSHARYLLPLVPLLSIFSVMFIIKGVKTPHKFILPICIAFPLTVISLYYEITCPQIKLLANLFFLALISMIVLSAFKNKRKIATVLTYLFFISLSLFTFSAQIYQRISKGQIKKTIIFGANNEYDKMADHFKHDKKYWFNGDARMIKFYTRSTELSKFKNYKLKKWLPKQNLEKNYNSRFTKYKDFYDYNKNIKNKIDYIVFLYSKKTDDAVFPRKTDKKFQEDALSFFQTEPKWLKRTKRIELKNKILFIYKIIDKENFDEFSK